MNKQRQAKDASINWLSEQKRINALAYPEAPKAPKVPNIEVGKTPQQIEEDAGFNYNMNAKDANSFIMDFYDRMQRDSRKTAERSAIEADKQAYRERQNTRERNKNSQIKTDKQLFEERRRTEMQGAYNQGVLRNDAQRNTNTATKNMLDFHLGLRQQQAQKDLARIQGKQNRLAGRDQARSNERIAASNNETQRYAARLDAQSRMFGSLTNNGGAGYSYWGGTI